MPEHFPQLLILRTISFFGKNYWTERIEISLENLANYAERYDYQVKRTQGLTPFLSTLKKSLYNHGVEIAIKNQSLQHYRSGFFCNVNDTQTSIFIGGIDTSSLGDTLKNCDEKFNFSMKKPEL